MKKAYLAPEGIYKPVFPELTPIKVKCPGCQSPIETEHINIDHNLAKCHKCESIYQLHNAMPFRHKPESFMPNGIEVLHLTNELDIELSWKRSIQSGLLFFTIFWNSIMFVIAAGAIISGNFIALLFMGLHIAVGIGLLYNQLTLMLNRTNIIVDHDRTLIEHRPLKLPFYNDKSILNQDIQQIFVEQYVESTTNDVPNHAFSVSIILKNGKREKLIKGIMHLEQAQYIEQEIENFLQIPDEKVKGEYLLGDKNSGKGKHPGFSF